MNRNRQIILWSNSDFSRWQERTCFGCGNLWCKCSREGKAAIWRHDEHFAIDMIIKFQYIVTVQGYA